jgi:hypothetical protein
MIQPPAPAAVQSHLASSAELITRFRSAAAAGVMDRGLVEPSTRLLLATRRLEDAAASDPALRKLLTDLDLVLVQIARYAARDESNAVELELIEDAISRRDLLAGIRERVRPRDTRNPQETTP